MPVGGTAGVLDEDLGVDEGPDLDVGVETTADAGDHHMLHREVARSRLIEQAGRRRPGQRWSHADMDGGHVRVADAARPVCALCIAGGTETERGDDGVHLEGHGREHDDVAVA